MPTHWILLAAINSAGPKGPVPDVPPTRTSSMTLEDMLLIAGLVIVIALVLFAVVYLTRKRARNRFTESGARILYKAEQGESERTGRRRKIRKRRPDHPDNLPRNPTLAEAGGLPPVRPEEPSEPAR